MGKSLHCVYGFELIFGSRRGDEVAAAVSHDANAAYRQASSC